MEEKKIGRTVEPPRTSEANGASNVEDVAKAIGEAFYKRITERADIRELLTRLAKK